MSLLVISQGTTSTIDSFFIFTTQTTARSRRPRTCWFLLSATLFGFRSYFQLVSRLWVFSSPELRILNSNISPRPHWCRKYLTRNARPSHLLCDRPHRPLTPASALPLRDPTPACSCNKTAFSYSADPSRAHSGTTRLGSAARRSV